MGNNATTGSGIASKTHQLIITVAIAKTSFALGNKKKGL